MASSKIGFGPWVANASMQDLWWQPCNVRYLVRHPFKSYSTMILLLSTNLTLMLHISRLCVEEKAVWPQQSFPFPFPPFPLASVQFPLSRRRRQAKVYFEPVSLREVMWEMRMSEQGLKLDSNSSGQPTDWTWRVARESSHQQARGKSLTRETLNGSGNFGLELWNS